MEDRRVRKRRSYRSDIAALVLAALALASCGTGKPPSERSERPVSPTTRTPPRAPSPQAGVVWPTALYDIGHSGHSPFAGPTTGRVRWSRKLEGNVTPGAVVGADNTIYLATNAGTLHALEPRTGADKWTLSAPGASGTDLSVSPAVLPSGVIVWPTAGGAIQGVAPSGERLWSIDVDGTATSPAPVGDRVYVMSTSGTLYALQLTNGGRNASVAWRSSLGSGSYASAAVSGAGLIAVTTGNDLVAMRDGGSKAIELWRADLGALSETSPAIGPNNTVVASGNTKSIQYFSATGTLLRSFENEAISYSSPVVTDGIVVQGNHRSTVAGYDLRTGTKVLDVHRWIRRAHRTAQVWTSAALDKSGNVYYGTHAGHIVGFAWSGALLFDIDAGKDAALDSYPALTSDGALIIGDTTGVVRAIADDGAS